MRPTQSQPLADDARGRRNAERTTRRRWRRRWLLCAAGATMALLLAEILVRAAGLAPSIDPQMGYLVEDAHLPYKPRPHSHITGTVKTGEYRYDHRHNSLGFRDVEHAIEKSAGTFRILGVGDSFTAGWGADYEETYLRIVERRLAERDGDHPAVEVLKHGIAGYFPATERLVVEHYGVQFAPDLVVVGFLPNDVLDTVRGVEAVVVDKRGYLSSAEAADLGAVGLWFYHHSHVARIGLGTWVRMRQRQLPPDWWMSIYRPDAEFEAAWREVERQYEHILAAARAAGARLVVLHIPENVPDEPFFAYPADRLRRWCAAHGAVFVDAAPQVLAAARAGVGPLYYPRDRHCTPAGYAAVAEALLDGLLAADLVP